MACITVVVPYLFINFPKIGKKDLFFQCFTMKFKAVFIVPEYKNIGVSAIQFIASTKPCRNFIACTPLQSDLWPRSSKSLKNKMNVVKENNKKYNS